MLAGELYDPQDSELAADRIRAQRLVAAYNATPPGDEPQRYRMLETLMGGIGERSVVMPHFNCDYGYNIHLGRSVFVNYGCVLLDCATIEIGDYAQLAPNVQLYTAGHPINADERRTGLEFANPIRIGRDAWLGGGVIVLPGITIGEAAVIGAGSVVTRDIPPSSVAVGNPARVVRTI